jgi:hypothetical protein
LAHNLVPVKAAAPVEMSAVWTAPGDSSGSESKTAGIKTAKQDGQPAKIESGRFLVQNGEIVGQGSQKTLPGARPEHKPGVVPSPAATTRTLPGTAQPAGSGKGQ